MTAAGQTTMTRPTALSRPQANARPGAGPRARTRRQRLAGFLFTLPLLVMLLAVVVWPVVNLVRYSFTEYSGLTPPEWVGWANYEFLFSWPDFRQILLNNALLVLGVAVWVVLPFVISIAIFELRSADVIRTLLFVPALLPPIIVGNVFRLVLADDGPINAGLRSAGLDWLAPGWLTNPDIVLITVTLVIAWATLGTGILFYSAGLSAISPSYIEAARLDGVSWRQLVWHIYRPALRPITRFWTLLLTVTTVTGFFPWIHGLTHGGPGVASTTLDYHVYRTLVQGEQLGRTAAIAVISIVLITVVVGAQVVARRLRGDEEWTS